MWITGEDALGQPPQKPVRSAVYRTQHAIGGETSWLSLMHASAPYAGNVTVEAGKIVELSWRTLAHEYLKFVCETILVDPPVILTEIWLPALEPQASDPTFGWMPLAWPPQDEDDGNAGDPFVSFRVKRQLDAQGNFDQALVLVASERLAGKFIGSGFGLSIIAGLQPAKSANPQVRILGLTLSLPYGAYRWSVSNTDLRSNESLMGELLVSLASLAVKDEIGVKTAHSSIFIRGARIGFNQQKIAANEKLKWRVERRCTGLGRSTSGHNIQYWTILEGDPDHAGTVVSNVALQAAATINPLAFPIDPSSQPPQPAPGTMRGRRPSRSDSELDYYRASVTIDSALEHTDTTHKLMRVVICPDFVRADRTATNPKTVPVPAGGPPVHSDDLSAISAFLNVKALFDRLAAYGFDSFQYFRIAKLPLDVHYRSGIRPGPGKDGKTINACVLVDGWPRDFVGPTPIGDRPSLEMHLALADLSRRGRLPALPAEPLGIATDERWVWHEIGHVLLMACVGELEFRFAHSPGDALAAIATDPDSYLGDPSASLPKGHAWRGATFPWVFIPRRHDRSVADGWSWGGTMHRALAQIPRSAPPRRKAYLSEQILSSSMFRLYLSLGGDTLEKTPEDVDTRHAASHYCVYLVINALSLFHTILAVDVVNDPAQFVFLLKCADSFTSTWKTTFPSPAKNYERVGGCAHKVVRWAFEAQGLFAPPNEVTNAPGSPPNVDVFLADYRPPVITNGARNIYYGPGNYLPVSLHWDRAQTEGGPTPLWQATTHAIEVQGNTIKVRVGNRGTQTAMNVEATVWFRTWATNPANTAPPTWHLGIGWTVCSPSISPGQNIPRGQEAEFIFSHTPPAGRYIILAHVDCVEDPANTNVSTLLPCSFLDTRLVDLVSGDNNLGLRVIDGP